MQFLSYLDINSILLPSSYITSNVISNLCYYFHLIFGYGLPTHINNIGTITLGLIEDNSPRSDYAI